MIKFNDELNAYIDSSYMQNHCFVATPYSYDRLTKMKNLLSKRNKQCAEMVAILKGFRTTSHCRDTWLYEMFGTIDAVLEEYNNDGEG